MTDAIGRLTPMPTHARVLRRAAPLLRPHRAAVGAALVAAVVATVTELAGPVLVGSALDAVLARDRDRLTVIAVAYAVLTLALAGARLARGRLAARASEAFLADLRETLTGTLLHLPLAFFDRHHAGELLSRATTDVDRLSRFVRNSLPSFVDAVLLLAVTAVVLVGASWELALVTLVYVPGQALAVRRYHRDSRSAYAAFADAEARTTAAVGETIAARKLLQGLDAAAPWAERVASVDRSVLDANDAALRADNRLSVLGLWQQGTLAAVVLAGGLLATDNAISVGVIATFALALRQLFGPLDSLAWVYADAQQARTNLARILEVIELATGDIARAASDGEPGLALDGVHYRYDGGGPALVGVTLRVAAGERVAIVGPTGAGKSTLAKVAAGLLHPDAGTVRIGGSVVLIPQEGLVLRGTLADNLRLVPGDHTDEDLETAVARAGLHAWIAQLPGGLDAPLTDRGANLSAGERQLVALARAALADPAVLILDEATADIDPRTESLVAGALDRLTAGRTVLVVAHRPATARRCDRIVALDGGRIRPSA
jgi:ABC-type multidrug transport system fused ATPase/permease subunit